MFKQELDRIEDLRVIEKYNRSQWVAPTFLIPKKDSTVHFISDFRELNKRILRQPYTIPKIQDLLLRLEGFRYGTTLYLNMGYYHIELSAKSKELCTIFTQWGKYEYQRLTVGMCNSPDIFQEKMSDIFVGLDTVRVYIDGLLHITKGSWTEHLTFLEEMFTQIQKAGLKFNARNYALGPTKLTTRVITSLVTGLCPYQRNLRQFKPSHFPKKTQTIASVYRYDQLLPLHVEKEL